MAEFFRKITSGDIRNILAIITTLGCFGLLAILIYKPVPIENKDIINIVVGFVFGSAMTGVFGYYFGSSKSVPTVNKDQTPNVG